MQRFVRTFELFSVLLLLAVLTACNGGSSGNSTASANSGTPSSGSSGNTNPLPPSEALTPLPTDPTAVALQDAAITYEPRLATATTDWDRAVLLRNLVYSHTMLGVPVPVTAPLTVIELKSVLDGDMPEICGGMSQVYIGLLQAFGLKARYLSLVVDSSLFLGGTGLDTHVSVEVYLDGAWVVQDPTFNIHWVDWGVPLGIVGLRNAFLYGFQPQPATDGFPTPPGRALADYYMPYGPLTANVEAAEVNMLGDGEFTAIADYPTDFSLQDYYASQLGIDANEGAPVPIYDPYTGALLYTAIHPYSELTLLYDEPFAGGLPQGWVAMPDVTLRSAMNEDLTVSTNTQPLDYQLISPVMTLDSGWNRLIVDGSVLRGGIGLYVLDVNSGTFVDSANFTARQWQLNPAGVAYVDFYLPQTADVLFILTNYRDTQSSSLWRLSRVSVGKVWN